MTFAPTDEVLVGLGPHAEAEPRKLLASDRAKHIVVTVLLVGVQVAWLGALLVAAYFFIHGSS